LRTQARTPSTPTWRGVYHNQESESNSKAGTKSGRARVRLQVFKGEEGLFSECGRFSRSNRPLNPEGYLRAAITLSRCRGNLTAWSPVTARPLMLFVKVISGPGACSGPCADQCAFPASDQATGASPYCRADTDPLGGFAFPG